MFQNPSNRASSSHSTPALDLAACISNVHTSLAKVNRISMFARLIPKQPLGPSEKGLVAALLSF